MLHFNHFSCSRAQSRRHETGIRGLEEICLAYDFFKSKFMSTHPGLRYLRHKQAGRRRSQCRLKATGRRGHHEYLSVTNVLCHCRDRGRPPGWVVPQPSLHCLSLRSHKHQDTVRRKEIWRYALYIGSPVGLRYYTCTPPQPQLVEAYLKSFLGADCIIVSGAPWRHFPGLPALSSLSPIAVGKWNPAWVFRRRRTNSLVNFRVSFALFSVCNASTRKNEGGGKK